ncbi:DUF4038 domain-containing protein [Diaminobutyricibacter tongyongensis]|uniref:DUF4038 domain-containing protein n=1 Tax=Leifsonia tongyongensis TaxID=1268043 RepID=A0A6L9XU66_9MICO|nr:DUF4038 domain-containing protein [Diaminobutyricibacter tongyongensis]NEN04951.1 DUF4038 domain-containing protein [Diaminobutyricibacter tongyongensis]
MDRFEAANQSEERSLRSVGPWSTVEFEFESDVDYARPYEEVDVIATFVGPHGETFRRFAFWNGGRSWRLRFAPTAAGLWAFTTAATDRTNGGLHSVAGELLCKEGSAAPLYEHGFLRASGTGTHLEHADGTPFFWLGDTHWRFAWEKWDRANKAGWSSQFRDTVDRRVRQGFTVYQANLLSWNPPPFWDRLLAGGEFDVAFFREVLDPRMEYIAASGLVNAIGLAWYAAVDGHPSAMVRLARYVVARYGSYPLVWTLGGEVAGYEPATRAQRLAAWRDVALAIQRDDDYRHPITAHLTCERPMPAEFQNEEWLTFTLSQLGHGDLDMSSEHWTDHLAAHPGKPLIEGESFYEGLTSVEPNGRRPVTDTMVRQVAYRAFQSGCSGYTYGAQGSWNGAWDSESGKSMWGDLPWHEGVDLPGAEQMGFLRRFYESVDWTSLSPAPELYSTESWINSTMYRPHVASNATRDIISVYFGETYRHDDGDAAVEVSDEGTYRVEWFDPRTGTFESVYDAERAENRRLGLPCPPTPGDWALLIRRNVG